MSKALRVLVTGAADAIGTAAAQALAHRGHSVVVTDTSAFSGAKGIETHITAGRISRYANRGTATFSKSDPERRIMSPYSGDPKNDLNSHGAS